MTSSIRYNRQTVIPEVDASGQALLTAARVLVVGAGGLGCPALLYLAGAGVGTIGIIDPDIIDISNLHRQTLYRTADAGLPKARLARERLMELNPDLTIHSFVEALDARNVETLFTDYDIIIDGTDNFAAKYLIADASVKTCKTVVYGAIQGFDGQVSVFDAAHGPCYRCLHPKPPEGIVLNCAESGIIGAVAGIVGAVQAMEAIKLIIGHESFRPLIGKLWLVDSRTMETRTLSIPKTKNCVLCSRVPDDIVIQNSPVSAGCAAVIEMDCKDLRDAVLVDVRELPEWDKGHIENAMHLPLSVLQENPHAFRPPFGERLCVLYCQRGQRSRKAAEILLNAGFQNILSLKGGYEAWQAYRKN